MLSISVDGITVFPFAQLRYAKIILDSLLSHTPIYHGKGNSNPLQFLAWEIPWTEEPGGVQSMGPQKSGT